MIRTLLISSLKYVAIVAFLCCIVSCNTKNANNDATKEKENVLLIMQSIEKDVSEKGVVAWLTYFEMSPDFLMASGGKLVFNSYDSAKNIIENVLGKNIKKISLHFTNIHIDPFTSEAAGIAADFHEDLTDFSGKINSINGYFTAVAHETGGEWKLRNVHWSLIP